ncbi:MAG: hypothetical protein Kow0059_04320 [Candidatus Sumerlaeia bacterium]
MAPQPQEILQRIDDYINFLQTGGGEGSPGIGDRELSLLREVREKLHSMHQHAPVDQLPPDARFKWIKKPFLRLMRLIGGRQASFNYRTIQAIESLLATIESSLLPALQRLDTQAKGLDELQNISKNLSERIDTLDKRTQSLDDGIQNLDKRAQSLSEQISCLNRQVEFLSKRLPDTESAARQNAERLDAFWKQLEDLRASDDWQKSELEKQNRYLVETSNALTILKDWIKDHVDPTLTSQGHTLAGLKAHIDRYDPVAVLSEVKALSSKVDTLSQSAHDLRQFADATGKTLSDLKRWVEDSLTPRTEALETTLSQRPWRADVEAALTEHNSSNQLRASINKLQTELSNLFNWVDKTLTPMTMELKDKVKELQIRADQIPAAPILSSLATHQQMLQDQNGKIEWLTRHVEPLQSQVRERVDQMGRELLIVLRDLERRFQALVEQAAATPSPQSREAICERARGALDQIRYFYFELRARGGEEWLAKKFQQYVSTIMAVLDGRESSTKGTPARRALDLGCGNGLFLSLLKDSHFEVLGVDSNAAMLASARKRGISVEHADALEFLRTQPKDHFDLISALEFIEHLPKERLIEFLDLSEQALRPGGLLLIETLNARTFAAYKWFFMDLTHQWLILPETLHVMLESRGLEIVLTDGVTPVESWNQLTEHDGSIERDNIRRLNETVFGMQEYFCLARKPLARS